MAVDDPAAPKRGRPSYVPTEKDRKTVEAMAACGIPQDDIGKVIGLRAKALRKHFRAEIDLAAIQANAKVATTLFAAASSGQDIGATIFWCKTRLRWSEPVRLEHVGEAGGPVEIRVTYEDLPAKTPSPALTASGGPGGSEAL